MRLGHHRAGGFEVPGRKRVDERVDPCVLRDDMAGALANGRILQRSTSSRVAAERSESSAASVDLGSASRVADSDELAPLDPSRSPPRRRRRGCGPG